MTTKAKKSKRFDVRSNGKAHADEIIRLDLGCGPNKRNGFKGVDSIKFDGVDLVHDLRTRWPFRDQSITEIHSSHFVEHLTAQERVFFVNEAYRVLKPAVKSNGQNTQGFMTIICPHWGSCRAYGDPTHQWPPISEFWFYYLSKDWRAGNAPHTDAEHAYGGFACDFDISWGYNLHPTIALKNSEQQQFATQFYKEAVQDVIATFVKK